MAYLGSWKIDDTVTFPANTHDPSDGSAADATGSPTYRIYEDETATPILTGSMALLDSANTAGLYSEQITLSAANGFEKGKSYTIYISATVATVEVTMSHTLQLQAEVAVASMNANVITAASINSGALTTAKFAADFLTSALIADNAISAEHVTQTVLDKVWDTTVRILTANTNFNDPTAAAISTAVWSETVRILTANTNFNDPTTGAIAAALNDISAADVWAHGTRALTDKTGFFISGGITTLAALKDEIGTKAIASGTCQARAGLTAKQLKLAASTITEDDMLSWCVIYFEAGPNEKSSNIILSTTQVDQVANCLYDFREAPDENSTYRIYHLGVRPLDILTDIVKANVTQVNGDTAAAVAFEAWLDQQEILTISASPAPTTGGFDVDEALTYVDDSLVGRLIYFPKGSTTNEGVFCKVTGFTALNERFTVEMDGGAVLAEVPTAGDTVRLI